MTRFIAIGAMGAEREIGGGGQLLWHNTDDLRHFKDLTEGHIVVMGSRTFESLPSGPLPNRKNIVLTRQRLLMKEEGGVLFWDIDRIDLLKTTLTQKENELVWIIGGEMIYRLTQDWWDEVILTKFPGTYPFADRYFPEFEDSFDLEEENEVGMLKYCYYRRRQVAMSWEI